MTRGGIYAIIYLLIANFSRNYRDILNMNNQPTQRIEEYSKETLQILLKSLTDTQKAKRSPRWKVSLEEMLILCEQHKTADAVTRVLNNGVRVHDARLILWIEDVLELDVVHQDGIGPKAGLWVKLTNVVREKIEPQLRAKQCTPETVEKVKKISEEQKPKIKLKPKSKPVSTEEFYVPLQAIIKHRMVEDDVLPMIKSIAVSGLSVK